MAPIHQGGGFDDRFLSKLSKVDQQGIESFLTNLVREKRFLQVVFNVMVDGVVVLRPNLEVLYINNAAVELLGITRRQRIYREHFNNLVEVPAFHELLSSFALKREKIMHAEVEIPAPSGRWLSVSILPLDELNVQPGASVMIIHDATEVRMAQQEREKLERATTLARLTTSLAHEIKNPLNSLQIHAQLLNRAVHQKRMKELERERVLKSSDIILEEISRLSEVVNNFLTAVRPTRPVKDKADINRLIEHVYATVQPEMESRGIDCVLRLDREIPVVQIDTAQITQAILNLLKNSMEAVDEQREKLENLRRDGGTGEGDLEVEDSWSPAIEINTRIMDKHYVIHVQDNGPGISEEDLNQVLEPYYTTKFSGTGLGLAIVSRIVEEHGGEMHINSRVGAGTGVAIRLPLDGQPVRLLEAQTET